MYLDAALLWLGASFLLGQQEMQVAMTICIQLTRECKDPTYRFSPFYRHETEAHSGEPGKELRIELKVKITVLLSGIELLIPLGQEEFQAVLMHCNLAKWQTNPVDACLPLLGNCLM